MDVSLRQQYQIGGGAIVYQGMVVINWHRYLDALYQIGYDDVLSVEHEDPAWATILE